MNSYHLAFDIEPEKTYFHLMGQSWLPQKMNIRLFLFLLRRACGKYVSFHFLDGQVSRLWYPSGNLIEWQTHNTSFQNDALSSKHKSDDISLRLRRSATNLLHVAMHTFTVFSTPCKLREQLFESRQEKHTPKKAWRLEVGEKKSVAVNQTNIDHRPEVSLHSRIASAHRCTSVFRDNAFSHLGESAHSGEKNKTKPKTKCQSETKTHITPPSSHHQSWRTRRKLPVAVFTYSIRSTSLGRRYLVHS